MSSPPPIASSAPRWEELYALAASQDGYFRADQARELGHSPQLLHHHLKAGRLERVRRGIYRLVHYPPTDSEDLVVAWLWSEGRGVFCLETALFLQELSDALPARIHLAVPRSWARRRLRVPEAVHLGYRDVDRSHRQWVGCLPVTTTPRTLSDCLDAGVDPDLVLQAVEEAGERGLLSPRQQERYLKQARGHLT